MIFTDFWRSKTPNPQKRKIETQKMIFKKKSHGGLTTVTVHGRLSKFYTSRIKHVFSRKLFHSIYIRSIRWSVLFFHWERNFCSSLFVAISPDSIGQGRTGIIHQIEGWKINKLKLFRVPLFCRLLHYCHEKWAVPDLEWPHVTFQFHLTRGAWWKF